MTHGGCGHGTRRTGRLRRQHTRLLALAAWACMAAVAPPMLLLAPMLTPAAAAAAAAGAQPVPPSGAAAAARCDAAGLQPLYAGIDADLVHWAGAGISAQVRACAPRN
jgi:hypothetical protein